LLKTENNVDGTHAGHREEKEERRATSGSAEEMKDPFGMHVGSFVWNLGDNTLRCSANAHSLVGMESISTLDEALSLLHPDDRDRFLRDTEKMISEKQLPPRELRVSLPDGTQKILLAAGEFSCDMHGKPVGCFGVVYHITK
jgi:hypothetical protein